MKKDDDLTNHHLTNDALTKLIPNARDKRTTLDDLTNDDSTKP